jgi:transglutaminase-like putative cysteine protease/outer membrane protein assembly factor BamB
MTLDSLVSQSKTAIAQLKTIRPLAAAAIAGVAFWDDDLIVLDSVSGYLLRVNPETDQTEILNPRSWSQLVGAKGLAIAEGKLWFTRDECVYWCDWGVGELDPQEFARLPFTVNGVAVLGATVYITCQQTGYIHIFSQQTQKEITALYAPGIGKENLTIQGEDLWVCDGTEQTVYCLDRATGEVVFSVLTPFEEPTGLAFTQHPQTGEAVLYVSYAQDEPYIRDNPNAYPNHEVQYRDRTFVHPLYFYYNREGHYALSNGYLVEMSYVEELSPLDEIELHNLEWRIALPAETSRQKVVKIEPVGLPYTEEIHEGQRLAVFKFDSLTSQDRHIFGWKATLEVWGIKYQFGPQDGENLPPLPSELPERYLVDDDDLAMDTDIIQRAAKTAVGGETNLLRKMYNIRNYVYDKLEYGIKPHIDTPDVALERGVGSCGEYLGVLLALARLNGIACRTVGRYKSPNHALLRNVPLEPDFNHVWMEFYMPGLGWLPMESNPDDIQDGGPYPTRFFMGLAWYHAEMAKGVPFEKLYNSEGLPVSKEQASLGELAINHVRFTILEELIPGE